VFTDRGVLQRRYAPLAELDGPQIIAARLDGIHAATVTIAGAVKPGTDFDPDDIAELFWTAHTDSKDAWQTEYRFTGAAQGATA